MRKEQLDEMTAYVEWGNLEALSAMVDVLMSDDSDIRFALDVLVIQCISQGNETIGLKYAEIFASRFPDDCFANNTAGLIMFLAGEYEEALAHQKRALGLLGRQTEDSNYHSMVNDVARTLLKMSKHDECLLHCNTDLFFLEQLAVVNFPSNIVLVERLAIRAEAESLKSNHSESLNRYRQVMKITTRSGRIFDADRSILMNLWGVAKQHRGADKGGESTA